MTRTKLLSLATMALLASLLTACTSFTPVYGDRPGAGMESVRFNFASPDSRIEQIIFDRLKLAFPGEAGPNDPVLDIAASAVSLPGSMSNAFAVARPTNVRVQATVTITNDDRVLFEATRFADTAYQSGKLTPVDIASSQGAQETAARAAAESLRISVLSGYRPAP
ncbi:hypothetical protein [Devosia salina]|uniref:LPS-assembly lipoprotein n=1 Tax=Devosia salina TaxID=2860336 RepID=A0ABX8WG84_9HYPH|nr:hypothetical protein [Devosia salina]QYO77756.1 hypothetical protein K1X15_04085 [Devosia salina]